MPMKKPNTLAVTKLPSLNSGPVHEGALRRHHLDDEEVERDDRDQPLGDHLG